MDPVHRHDHGHRHGRGDPDHRHGHGHGHGHSHGLNALEAVIPEAVNQVAFAVVGNDVAITMAAEAGQLQLNAFEPVIEHAVLQGISWMTTAFERLTTLCITGIEVDREQLSTTVARSVGVVTALTPYIGRAAAAEIAKSALAGTDDVRSLVLATGALSEDVLDDLLRPERLAGLGEQVGPPAEELVSR